MTQVRKSLALSALENYLGVILQIASTVIVSRLLTPTEVGVFAIAAVFTALASAFRDFGVSQYLVQAPELTAREIRAAFALNMMVSWTFAGALLLMAPAASNFYAEPGVGKVMSVQAMTFLILPFGAITLACFRRELNYAPIVISNLISRVVAFVVAVALAYFGFGYMSLAWSSLASIVAVVLASLWFRPPGFPRWPSLQGIGEVFNFGKFTSSIYILNTLGRGAPELVIGRVRGPTDVGIFSRGYGLVEVFQRLIVNPLLQVCMPYFAQHNREHGSLAPAYTQSVSLLTAVGWPFLGCVAVLAYAGIQIVYGPQWLSAVPLSQVLCLAGGIELLLLLAHEALLADGLARQASVMQAQIIGLRIAGLAMVVPFGLLGACWGLVAAACCGAAVAAWHLRRVGIHTWPVFRACLPSLIATVVTTGPMALLEWWIPIDNANFVRWAVAGTAWAVVSWMVCMRQMRHHIWGEFVSIVALAKSKFASH